MKGYSKLLAAFSSVVTKQGPLGEYRDDLFFALKHPECRKLVADCVGRSDAYGIDMDAEDWDEPTQRSALELTKDRVSISFCFQGKWTPLAQLPSGLQDLIYFVATAHSVKDGTLWFDEPLTGLHPPIIGRVRDWLHQRSGEGSPNLIIATHSPTFIDHKAIRGGSWYVNNGIRQLPLPKQRLSAQELGIPFADRVLIVEGPHDVRFIEAVKTLAEGSDMVELFGDIFATDLVESVRRLSQWLVVPSGGSKNRAGLYLAQSLKVRHAALFDHDAVNEARQAEKKGARMHVWSAGVKDLEGAILASKGALDKLVAVRPEARDSPNTVFHRKWSDIPFGQYVKLIECCIVDDENEEMMEFLRILGAEP
jgi:hypothetical protein